MKIPGIVCGKMVGATGRSPLLLVDAGNEGIFFLRNHQDCAFTEMWIWLDVRARLPMWG